MNRDLPRGEGISLGVIKNILEISGNDGAICECAKINRLHTLKG